MATEQVCCSSHLFPFPSCSSTIAISYLQNTPFVTQLATREGNREGEGVSKSERDAYAPTLISSHSASGWAANARKLMNAVSAQHLSHTFSISYREILGNYAGNGR